jgi:ribosomal protein L37AE/L43A
LYLAQLDPEFISISGLTAAIEKFIKRVVAPYLFRSKKINIARCKECGQLFAQKRVNQVFCCTSCNNKCKGKVYREKHLRVKRKEHEHDQKSSAIITNN